jgi:hypothetical protein
MKGQVVSGELGRIVIRQKSDEAIELGELLVSDGRDEKILLYVYDLLYGSQISEQNLELISGMHLEEATAIEFMDPALRNYLLALAKPMLAVNGSSASLCKSLPQFFSPVRGVRKEDVGFITKPQNALYVGKLRSGRKILDVDVYLPGEKVFSHHILIPATTGRGKSNLTSVMLWDCMDKKYCGILVLDPHDEYYGRVGKGLKDHPSARDALSYYTPNKAPAGALTLVVNLADLKPHHFDGVALWTDPQRQALSAAYHHYGDGWIERVIVDETDPALAKFFQEGTLTVVKRKLMGILGLSVKSDSLECYSVFDSVAGLTTVTDVCNDLERGKMVVVDTSSLSGAAEILVGSVVAVEMMRRYRNYKRDGVLEEKPVVSIVLEEAPRVLGKDVLQQGSNIFETIAREGRKFKIGLMAITQLPSEIPRSILANMNTKIILGLEMKPERDAIIDSASQDLSTESRTIASLDRGEAIITSNFIQCALPVKVPLFEDVVRETLATHKPAEKLYAGIGR